MLHVIAEDPPSKETLLEAFARSDKEARKFFNTSGKAYRAGGWSAKVKSLSDEEAAAALASDGMLIKRPLLISEDGVLVGFREAEYEALFG